MDNILISEMLKKNIDPEITKKILNTINAPDYINNKSFNAKGIPSPDNNMIVDLSGEIKWEVNYEQAKKNLEKFTDAVTLSEKKVSKNGTIALNSKELENIGLHLLPFTSLGILNGGSASSYVDYIKNSSYNLPLFCHCENLFKSLAEKYKNYPKGLAPAYINSDYTEGYSFSELKMRSLLIKANKYMDITGKKDFGHLLFQMTSCNNNDQINKRFKEYANSKILRKLSEKTGIDITSPLTGIQPHIPAFTHSSFGKKREIFTDAYGDKGRILSLPGGHGQNFHVLKTIYETLYKEGKRFVYLGNVDNIGFNIDFAEVAILALSGKEAAFDFSFKTPVDVKGGILVYDENNKFNCEDIGLAIPLDFVKEEEKKGKAILFNCATGLFNLEYLVKNLERIIDNLPLRLSDQEKDAGKYSQAEQTTWEIIGLLDDFIIFGVDKYKRFLASKLVMENMLISRPGRIFSYFDKNKDDPMNSISIKMKKGLENILENEMLFGMPG
ncbi:MAG: UTP--glucose-1-phosphate uridylyltransferase [Spirochaetes bacterium]|nr:UTP--glucose-1-phosphate uridylyltransferase [Spirochaetota bacterium]